MTVKDLNEFWYKKMDDLYLKGLKLREIAKELGLPYDLVLSYIYQYSEVKVNRNKSVSRKDVNLVKDLSLKGFTMREMEQMTGISYKRLRYIKYQVIGFTKVYS